MTPRRHPIRIVLASMVALASLNAGGKPVHAQLLLQLALVVSGLDLPVGIAHAHAISVRIPADTVPGTHRILVQADAANGVVESDEGNNVAATQITVTP